MNNEIVKGRDYDWDTEVSKAQPFRDCVPVEVSIGYM